MNQYTELNLEENMPTVNQAIDMLKFSLNLYKKDKFECVLIIHGYGSSGKGGKICDACRKFLNTELKKSIIKTFIPGENFNIFTDGVIKLKSKYRELEKLLKVCNHGVTVVVL